MKTTAILIVLVGLAGCNSSPTIVVPKAPHGGVLVAFPEGKNVVEIVRQDVPDAPGKVQIVAYFLDDQLKPLTPAPTTASFQPKAPRGASAVELKPTGDANSTLASPSLDESGEITGELSTTIDGKSVTIPISLR